MKLTVEEAAKRRCQESYAPPLAAGGYVGSVATQATSHPVGGSYCIASMTSPAFCIGPQCMAWEFDGETLDGTPVGYCGKVQRR